MLSIVVRQVTWVIVAALIALSVAQRRPMPNAALVDE